MVTVDPEPIPDELKDRDQWLLWDSSHDTPRQPHWEGDFYGISWSDPEDWHSFEEALALARSRESWGIGYVMALDNDDCPRGLYGCLDLDGCLSAPDSPKGWLPSLRDFIDDGAYIERSPSGDGLHIPIVGHEPPEWWSDSHFSEEEHEGVEFLTNKFVTFTGDQLGDQHDGVCETDPTDFLFHAYQELNGEAPRIQPSDDARSHEHRDAELDKSDVEEALSHINSDCGYPKWRDIGFAVHDWDSGQTGKSVFESWSRGPGWDDDSQRYIDAIWENADQGSGVTVATLVHHAKQGGWTPPSSGDDPDEILSATDGDETAESADDSIDTGWKEVYQAYQAADNDDEKLLARHAAVSQLCDEHHWRNIRENDELYAFDEEAGIYRPDGESRARDDMVEHLGEQFRAHELSEALTQIRGRHTVMNDDMGGPDNMICCENCVIEITADGLETHDHDPAHNFMGRVQTEYDPEAECPRWRKFLKESVTDSSGRQKLQEFAGYCLMHWKLPHHKALFLVGPTASGKSTFLDSIRTMLGNDAVSSLTPQQMTSERFGGAELHGSWANIRNDIPTTLIENTGQFKELIAGDPVKAEQKYEDPFMFEPTAKHMFSANQLPDADTDDRAFFRRILLVAFPNEVPREERDPHLDDKLQGEHAGILNWALDGLQRLMNQGGFTGDRSPFETEDTWAKWGNSIERFEQVALRDEHDSAIPTSEIFQAYLEFCDQEGIPAETTQQVVTKGIKAEGYTTGREYVDGNRQRVVNGVAWTGRGEGLAEVADSDEGGSDASGLDGYE